MIVMMMMTFLPSTNMGSSGTDHMPPSAWCCSANNLHSSVLSTPPSSVHHCNPTPSGRAGWSGDTPSQCGSSLYANCPTKFLMVPNQQGAPLISYINYFRMTPVSDLKTMPIILKSAYFENYWCIFVYLLTLSCINNIYHTSVLLVNYVFENNFRCYSFCDS